jgi:hypothetical protein
MERILISISFSLFFCLGLLLSFICRGLVGEEDEGGMRGHGIHETRTAEEYRGNKWQAALI